MLRGDPRREGEVQPYSATMFTPEEATTGGETFLLLTVGCGMAALFLRHRAPAWASLFSALLAMANMRGPESNSLSGVGIALFAFFSAYAAPPLPAAATTAALQPTALPTL
jgi:hypothetical protein